MSNQALIELLVSGTDEDVVLSYSSLAERASDARFGLDEDEVVILDIETTGFDPRRAQIIEIAAAILKGPDVVDRFQTLVACTGSVPEEIVRLTGITDEMLQGAPGPVEAIKALASFAGGRDLIAHNCGFDRSFIEHYASGTSLPGRWMDSLELARIALPRFRSFRLGDLALAFSVSDPTHRASSDVDALCSLWRIMLVALSDLPPGLLEEIVSMHPSVDWPLRGVLSQVAGAHPGKGFDLKRIRTSRVVADKEQPRPDAFDIDLSFPALAEIVEQFEPAGAVGNMYSGYEPRAEQVIMAQEVLGAFRTGTHRAIEAGTGVGKSVAYLVPSAEMARANNITVGIATKTNALMDQLVYHELPKLSSQLDRPLRYAALKGYDHYPCLRKIERAMREGGTSQETLAMLAMLLTWTAQSSWGDLDALNLNWRTLPRREIVSTHAECLKSRCRFFPNLCYLHGSRRRATSADIVVTNHALLFRDVVSGASLLPPIRHWVIDEAHSVEAEARRQLVSKVEAYSLQSALDSLHSKRGGVTSTIRRKVSSASGSNLVFGPLAKLEDVVQRTSIIAESFFSYVKELESLTRDSGHDSVDLWVSDQVRQSTQWSSVESMGRSLQGRLDELLKCAKDVLSILGEMGADLVDSKADLAGLAMRVADELAGLTVVLDGLDEGLVYSARISRKSAIGPEALTASKLDIGEVLAELFYPEVRSVCFTSATIAVGESFDHFTDAVGLGRLDRSEWDTLRLDSSYDFERNMRVYLPIGMPDPRSAAYSSTLERLLYGVHVAMGGSVLTLFTNRRDMEQMYAALAPRLEKHGLDLIVQWRGASAKRLRDEFIADERLSLFALRSFWEGFDAPGSTLKCVVVPKLPFGLPTDPLACERGRHDSRAWSRYALPEAVIDLKQAAGRLIRSSTDRGCLVIADSRVVEKGYGRNFIEALPVSTTHRLEWDELFADISEEFGHRD